VIAPHVKKAVIRKSQAAANHHSFGDQDRYDYAGVVAQLYAGCFLVEVWIPDEPRQALRRQVTRRNQMGRQRSRLRNIIQ
jgi:transposase